MKKFFMYFGITLLASCLLTFIYYLIDFDLKGWFTYKYQFIMIPGAIWIFIGVNMFQKGPIAAKQAFHVNSSSFKDHQNEMIENERNSNPKIPMVSAFIISGAIQVITAFVLYKF